MRTDHSDALFARSLRHIPGGVNSPVRAFRGVDRAPFFVRRASGCRLEDVDGNTYIDYVGTWGPAILGHAAPCVTDALTEALRDGVSFGACHSREPEMAELISSWVPSVEKVRMVNSGTEAVLSAIRLARGYTGRDMLVKFTGCYHGHVDSLLVAAGSGALTHGQPDSAGVPADLAALTLTIPYNDPEALAQVFQEYGDRVACVIVEPYPGNAGLYLPQPGFLQQMRDLTKEHGALLIFDEVMTGFRIARGGVQEVTGVTPDLTTLGKVIGGGLPVGAFGGRANIMNHLAPDGPVYQAGTLSGNPLALAAGLAQLREMDRIDAWTVLEKIGARMEAGVRALLKKKGRPLTFHRAGSMFCLYFTEQPVLRLEDAKQADTTAFRRHFATCLEQGVFFAPSPFESGFLCTRHDEEAVDRTLEVMEKALDA